MNAKLPHGLTSTTLAILLDRALDGDPTPEDARVLAEVANALTALGIDQQAEIDRLQKALSEANECIADQETALGAAALDKRAADAEVERLTGNLAHARSRITDMLGGEAS